MCKSRATLPKIHDPVILIVHLEPIIITRSEAVRFARAV
jgi:hypothetical protein